MNANPHKQAVYIASATVLSLCVLSLVVWRKPLLIGYHRYMVSRLLSESPKPDKASGLTYYDNDWSEAFDWHRDRLIELGYLKRREFDLSTIKCGSPGYKELWREIREQFPDSPFTSGIFEPNAPAVIFVYDTKEELPRWEAFFLAHDKPPDGPLPAAPADTTH